MRTCEACNAKLQTKKGMPLEFPLKNYRDPSILGFESAYSLPARTLTQLSGLVRALITEPSVAHEIDQRLEDSREKLYE